ncbi:MAG: hypothetical protein WD851_18830 [Pirellulales bacterium]
MAKLTLTIAAVAALCFVSGQEASAQGFHFGGGGVHVDIGRPHGGYSYHPRSRYTHSSYYGGGYHGYPTRSYWHDTSHYDYHPGEFVRHRNHYHYVPGHYDYHHDGHWDHD